ncbi:hypothetical protein PPSIR1_05613 [Plesiocystis pacifica SIR-1]|uniref:Ion transport domain-containing protein n=1 Tax=Plesiocystis pacifica SIR-1 TaxID=391625 RepID=A6FX95_9BACT|nr:hypothetical protein PPSIR1_05613 [Plesiocystis pacifica SIR-1]
MFPWVARFLGRVEVRLVLSVAIIISLLPFDWAAAYDPLFLGLFGLEFIARALLIFRGEDLYTHGNKTGVTPTEAEIQERRGWQVPRPLTLALLFFDLLALMSFLPSLISGIEDTRWLRLFRLSRMLLLISYWAPLVRDVWAVLSRRERLRQVVLMGFIVLALSFAGAVVIDQLNVADQNVVDFTGDDEIDSRDEGFWIHLWWAFRQIQDPGNMLPSPGEPASVLVSVALTIVGLFMVSFLIGLGTDVVRELMELSRLRPPELKGHTIIVNIDLSTQQLLHELLRYSQKLVPEGRLSLHWLEELLRNTRRGIRSARYLVVGRSPDPPDFLRQPELARIVYRQGHVDDETFLVRTDVADAQRMVLLADLGVEDPDAETIQALLTVTESLREADSDPNRQRPTRKRLLIAEILDESNVPAARAAINGVDSEDDGSATRAFVVPSERLIALFIACITRRPGAGRLLEELLTSHGHELYTLFFSLPGLGYVREGNPDLPEDPGAIMGELIRRARSLPSGRRVVPVGILLETSDDEEARVHINPEPSFVGLGASTLDNGGGRGVSLTGVPTVSEVELLEQGALGSVEPHEDTALDRSGRFAQDEDESPSAASSLTSAATVQVPRCLGFVAIADTFDGVRELAEDLYDRPREAIPSDPAGAPSLPNFVQSEITPLRRVLVCGFRSGTVSMVEALIQAEPEAKLLIMVASEEARAAAWDDFDAHTRLVERGLLGGEHGRFVPRRKRPWALEWVENGAPVEKVIEREASDEPHIRIVTGDWSSSRRLTKLPEGFGHVETVDAVILISSEHSGSDARTAKTLMKIETLTQKPRIVAEVLDVELARRLRRRTAANKGGRIRVYSIQELRAFFMFQSVVVPAFDLVYAELMGPWGQSFVQLRPDPGAKLEGTCTFEELANCLSMRDQVLCGVELRGDNGQSTTLHVASGGEHHGDRIDLARVAGVWVIARDHAQPIRERA